MRCYYEVLEVGRKADEEEIRRAYKAMARRWHPDKNRDRISEATEAFQEIQRAYSVLSDPDSRAWYDAHRLAILRGESSADGGDDGERESDGGINLWPYFSAACFSGFGDGDGGFYAVYAAVFARIAALEREDDDDDDDDGCGCEEAAAPGFGASGSAWEDVAAFYAHWKGFASARTFAHADAYNRAEAPGRATKRAIDRENRRLRDRARRAFSDRVRHLAEFVCKLDPRVREHRAEAARRAEEAEAADAARRRERDACDAEARRAAAAERDAALAAEIERLRLEQHGAAEYNPFADAAASALQQASDEDDQLADSDDETFCEVCQKRFGNPAQLERHRKTKPHKDRLRELLAEVAMPGEDVEALAAADLDEVLADDPEQQRGKGKKKKKKGKNKGKKQPEEEEEDEKMQEEDEGATSASAPPAAPSSVASKKQRREERRAEKERRKERQREAAQQAMPTIMRALEERREAAIEAAERGKRGKKGAKQAPASPSVAAVPNACNTCGLAFATRNALFAHLRESGHQLRL